MQPKWDIDFALFKRTTREMRDAGVEEIGVFYLGYDGALREPLPCWSAFTEGHVTAEGRLSACCFDATANWTMGDLNRESFMTAWNSAAFVALREAHLRKDVRGTVCEVCVAYS